MKTPVANAVAAGAMTTLLVVASARGQSVRLELRIVPQSGVPGVLCVYDDPPTPLGS